MSQDFLVLRIVEVSPEDFLEDGAVDYLNRLRREDILLLNSMASLVDLESEILLFRLEEGYRSLIVEVVRKESLLVTGQPRKLIVPVTVLSGTVEV